MSNTETINIVVNGESHVIPGGGRLPDLLLHLAVDPSRVAIELNRRIVRKPDWPDTAINEGATIEIVHFVGGG
ncbi:MAG: sulfur carrier protein ThiS [Bryobacteraceae bacterium]